MDPISKLKLGVLAGDVSLLKGKEGGVVKGDVNVAGVTAAVASALKASEAATRIGVALLAKTAPNMADVTLLVEEGSKVVASLNATFDFEVLKEAVLKFFKRGATAHGNAAFKESMDAAALNSAEPAIAALEQASTLFLEASKAPEVSASTFDPRSPPKEEVRLDGAPGKTQVAQGQVFKDEE